MIIGKVAGFGLDTRTALLGAMDGSIVTAGTGSIAIGGASLAGGKTSGTMGEVLGWSTTGASSICAGSMVSTSIVFQ
jgi:N-acetylglucosamine kinase-like BadF-type ATPase